MMNSPAKAYLSLSSPKNLSRILLDISSMAAFEFFGRILNIGREQPGLATSTCFRQISGDLLEGYSRLIDRSGSCRGGGRRRNLDNG